MQIAGEAHVIGEIQFDGECFQVVEHDPVAENHALEVIAAQIEFQMPQRPQQPVDPVLPSQDSFVAHESRGTVVSGGPRSRNEAV